MQLNSSELCCDIIHPHNFSLAVWRSNGTFDGTLSWYSVNSYGVHTDPDPSVHNRDPWHNPYPSGELATDPAGWGYLLWPPPPG